MSAALVGEDMCLEKAAYARVRVSNARSDGQHREHLTIITRYLLFTHKLLRLILFNFITTDTKPRQQIRRKEKSERARDITSNGTTATEVTKSAEKIRLINQSAR